MSSVVRPGSTAALCSQGGVPFLPLQRRTELGGGQRGLDAKASCNLEGILASRLNRAVEGDAFRSARRASPSALHRERYAERARIGGRWRCLIS
jgi:hypothetical protein